MKNSICNRITTDQSEIRIELELSSMSVCLSLRLLLRQLIGHFSVDVFSSYLQELYLMMNRSWEKLD